MADSTVTRVASLYLHVPFCAQKCAYCAFYSEPSKGDLVNRYVAALARELEIVADDLKPGTVFFGGGTPSLLNLRQWEQILQAMERLNLLGAEEFTVECNPATVSADKAKLLRDFGVNRVSMGVQSLDESLLDRLGRIHTREMVFKSFDILRKAGFDNLNLDLMFAIPGQTLDLWRDTLNEAMAMQSEHLSTYEVIYEDDTPLFAQLQAGEFNVDEDLACAMYELLVEQAAAAGFQQYEVANFAAVFNGKILVRKDAQKTDAKQTNKNLVLSEDAVINTKPELQILADDVRCTHGATIGQLDPEGIFYLQSRGIGLADARNLLIYAFARDIVDRVKVASLRDQLEKLLLEKLHGTRN